MADTRQVAFRLPTELVDALDRYAAKMSETQPGLTFTRADAVRVLLTRALSGEISQPAPRSRGRKSR